MNRRDAETQSKFKQDIQDKQDLIKDSAIICVSILPTLPIPLNSSLRLSVSAVKNY